MAYTAPNLSLAVWDQFEDVFDHSQLAANWLSVDNHNHTGPPKGLQIPSGGLEAGSVRTVDLHDGAVTTVKVGDGQITNIKIADLNASKLTGVLPVSLLDASTLAQTGDLKPIAHSSPSAGWLLCDGAAVSRTTYSVLYAKIGSVYGVGNGTSTFNLPDLRGRAPVGADNGAARLTANGALGKFGGAEKHTLATTEIPAHGHTGTTAPGGPAAHSHDGATNSMNRNWSHNHYAHNPPINPGDGTWSTTLETGGGTRHVPFNNNFAGGALGWVDSTDTNHEHSFTTAGENQSLSHAHDFTTADAGSGGTHNNMQPFQTVNWAIKT